MRAPVSDRPGDKAADKPADARRVTRGMGREVIMSRNEFADENSIIFSGPAAKEAKDAKDPVKEAKEKLARPGSLSPMAKLAPRNDPKGPDVSFGPAPAKRPLISPGKLVTPAGKPPSPVRKPMLDTPHATLPPEGEDRTFVSEPPAFDDGSTIDVPDGMLLPHEIDPAATGDRTADTALPAARAASAAPRAASPRLPEARPLEPRSPTPAPVEAKGREVKPAEPAPRAVEPKPAPVAANPPSAPAAPAPAPMTPMAPPGFPEPPAGRVQEQAVGTETVRRVTSRPALPPAPAPTPAPPPRPAARTPLLETELPSIVADDELLTEVQEAPQAAPLDPPPPPPSRRPAELPLSAPPDPQQPGAESVPRWADDEDEGEHRAPTNPVPRRPVAPPPPPPPRRPSVEPPRSQPFNEDPTGRVANRPVDDAAVVEAGWDAPQQDISMKYKISHRSSPRSERRWFGVVLFLVAALVTGAVVFVAMNSGAPPAPEMGALEVISIPAGGKLTVDGADKGSTPQTLDAMKVGTSVKLHVELEHFEPWQRVETVNAAHTVKVIAALKPILGTLRVLSQPPGAEVFLDNRSLGVTPLEKDVDPFTDGTIEVRKAGFKPSRQPLTWQGKRESLLNFTLLPGRDLLTAC